MPETKNLSINNQKLRVDGKYVEHTIKEDGNGGKFSTEHAIIDYFVKNGSMVLASTSASKMPIPKDELDALKSAIGHVAEKNDLEIKKAITLYPKEFSYPVYETSNGRHGVEMLRKVA